MLLVGEAARFSELVNRCYGYLELTLSRLQIRGNVPLGGIHILQHRKDEVRELAVVERFLDYAEHPVVGAPALGNRARGGQDGER